MEALLWVMITLQHVVVSTKLVKHSKKQQKYTIYLVVYFVTLSDNIYAKYKVHFKQ